MMLRGFSPLVRMYWKGTLATTLGANRTKKRRSIAGWGALALLGGLMLLIAGTYSITFAFAMGRENLDVMLGLMLIIELAFPAMFMLFIVRGVVFTTKDIDLAFSLPVTPFALMLARVATLYLESLFMLEIGLLTTGITYLAFGGAGGAGFMALLLLSGLFLALLPPLMGLVLSGLATVLTARLPFKNLFATLLMLLLLVGIGWFSFVSQTELPEIGSYAAVLRGQLAGIAPLHWLVRGITAFQPGSYLLAALLCLLPTLVVVWLFSLVYKRTLTWLASHGARNDYRLGRLAASGKAGAMLKKEFRRFFGTPAYLFNAGIGGLMLIVAGVACFVLRGRFQPVLSLLRAGSEGAQFSQLLAYVLLGGIVFLLMMIYPASVSFNLEGKNLWILKSAPLDPRDIFLAKGGVQFLFSLAGTVLAAPLAGLSLGLSPLDILATLLACTAFSALMAASGLLLNLRFPRLDADNEVIAIKQSASALLSMAAGLGWALLGGGVCLLLALVAGLPFAAVGLVLTLVYAVLFALLWRRLLTRGRQLYTELM